MIHPLSELTPSIFEPSETLPQWIALLTIAFTVWSYQFVFRRKPDAIHREEARRRDAVVEMMNAVIAYADTEDCKSEDKRTLPEPSRVLTLLWDKTHGCRTTAWGIDPNDALLTRCEDLYKRVAHAELRKAIELTARARTAGEIHKAGKDDMKRLAEHESGEKLHTILKTDKEATKNLGRSFAAPRELRREAEELMRAVYRDQWKNARELFRMVWPVLPYVVYSISIGILHTALRSKFHQIGLWVMTIEKGAAGDMEGAMSNLFNLWVGHMIIKLIELPEYTYTKRSKDSFGNIIRNGVLSAMVRQDYEYFDRTPAGVLQDRLNRDADELGENLIGFPKEMLNKLVWVCSNMTQVYLIAPPRFFAAACVPVFLMCAFQFFTFKYFRSMNERARRVEEEGISATSEVLRQIKTVRQFASEQRAAATYARRNLARQLIGESVTTFKRALEMMVWCLFDSGICLTIILGLPYVTSGELSAGQLIDCFCKLNFNVNFCLREILEQIPRMARLLEPMGRICDLMQATSLIEPATHPAHVVATDAVQLGAILDTCAVAIDEKGVTRLMLVDAGSLGHCDPSTKPAVGAQVLFLSSADHRYATPFELVPDPSAPNPTACPPAGLTYPVRLVFSTKIRPARFRGHIEFQDVHFAYPTDLRKPVLQGLSLTVEPGEKVALVGPTGCGKSSCMSLLQRLYEPSKGSIRLDGRPLSEYDLHNLRARVVIVDQNTVLFSTSIKENITYGMDRVVSDDEIIAACKRAHAWEFISEKPDKLLTHLTGGSNLSGGQKQRLAIARAIVRAPDVILLDEATSALDNENEAKVQKALDELARQGSALVIAHRLSTVRDADKIVVVDHGRAVEIGSHDELIARLQTKNIAITPPQAKHLRVSDAPTKSISLFFENSLSEGQGSSHASIADGRKESMREERSRSASPVLSRSASHSTDTCDDDTEPLIVRRVRTSPSTSSTVRENTGATYRRLWEAATGTTEKHSLSQLGTKIAQMEAELAALKATHAEMARTKQQLLESC